MNLILVEGLPGTGKSTTASWIAESLAGHGVAATLLTEGDPRIPLDFYNMAGVPLSDFERVCESLPQHADMLRGLAKRTENYAYIRLDDIPSSTARLLQRWDMGDESNQQVSVAQYTHCALERLKNWDTRSCGTLVVDSGYLQNPVNELLFRHATDAEVRSFIATIAEIIAPLKPVCVYLKRQSAAVAIDYAKGAKGSGWAERVDALLLHSGSADLFERRFVLELELLELTDHIVCEVDDSDWSGARAAISTHFGFNTKE